MDTCADRTRRDDGGRDRQVPHLHRGRGHAGARRPGRRRRARCHGAQLALHGARGGRRWAPSSPAGTPTPARSRTSPARPCRVASWSPSPCAGGRTASPTPRTRPTSLSLSGGRIVRDQVWCGGRWPAALLAEMAEAGVAERARRPRRAPGPGRAPHALGARRHQVGGPLRAGRHRRRALRPQVPGPEGRLDPAGDRRSRSLLRPAVGERAPRPPPARHRPRRRGRGLRRHRRESPAARRRRRPCSRPTSPFTPEQHARFVEHMAALHAAFWGWRDDVGLTPLSRRYLMFSPDVAAAEAAQGSEAAVPQVMAEGWGRLPDVSPAMARVVLPLLRRPGPARRRSGAGAAHPRPRGLEGRQSGQPPRRQDGLARLRRGARRGLPAGGPVLVPGAQRRAPARAQGRGARVVPRRARSVAASPPPGGGTTPSRSSCSAAWCSSDGRRRSGGPATSCRGGRSGCSAGRAAWPAGLLGP